MMNKNNFKNLLRTNDFLRSPDQLIQQRTLSGLTDTFLSHRPLRFENMLPSILIVHITARASKPSFIALTTRLNVKWCVYHPTSSLRSWVFFFRFPLVLACYIPSHTLPVRFDMEYLSRQNTRTISDTRSGVLTDGMRIVWCDNPIVELTRRVPLSNGRCGGHSRPSFV